MKTMLALAAAFTLAGCATTDVSHYRAATPVLDLGGLSKGTKPSPVSDLLGVVYVQLPATVKLAEESSWWEALGPQLGIGLLVLVGAVPVGLVFGLLTGGCCRGVVFRVTQEQAPETLARLWSREMVTGVYDPRWLVAHTPQGPVRSLAFTLSRNSPSHTGELTEEEYQAIFALASGIYGTTHDYAHRTLEELRRHNIRDRNLERLLRLIQRQQANTTKEME